MNIVQQAFREIYPDRELNKEIKIKYSGRFKSFNANVKHSPDFLHFHLSREWKSVSREIQMGLIQSLLVKIFKGKPNTGYRDLYESFIKNLSKYSIVTKSDPILEASFKRVNDKYFYGMIEKPNLEWGRASTTKLGSYEYQSNTINISTIFQKSSQELLDCIIHHEMLHKKLKFTSSPTGRSLHHSTEFKKAEKQFENISAVEKELRSLCRKSKIKGLFFQNWLK